MQMFSIARMRSAKHMEIGNTDINPLVVYETKLDMLKDNPKPEEVYMRIEANGNFFWTLEKETASQFEHAEAELRLKDFNFIWNCYLVEAVRTDA